MVVNILAKTLSQNKRRRYKLTIKAVNNKDRSFRDFEVRRLHFPFIVIIDDLRDAVSCEEVEGCSNGRWPFRKPHE